MKNYKFKIALMLLASIFLFGGCYTQLAVKERVIYQREYSDYSEDEYDTTQNYSDEQSEYSEENYDEDGVTINNYYSEPIYPSYRRYFWSYYPSVSIGAYFGSYYGSYYYDTYCYDPFFYPGWCFNPWYDPYYSYYPSWWLGNYYPYNYYGNYGSGWAYNNDNYKTRSNSGYKIRNNDGLRGGSGTRGSLTRGGGSRDDLWKNRTRNSEVSRTLTREGTRTGRNDEVKRTRTGETVTGDRKEIKRRDIIEDVKKNTRGREEIDMRDREGKKSGENKTGEVKTKREIKENPRGNRQYPGTIKREEKKRTESPNIKRDNRNSGRENRGTYERKQTTKSSPKYSAPKRTESQPRTYSSPRSSSPPSRGSSSSGRSSGGSRSSGNDRRR